MERSGIGRPEAAGVANGIKHFAKPPHQRRRPGRVFWSVSEKIRKGGKAGESGGGAKPSSIKPQIRPQAYCLRPDLVEMPGVEPGSKQSPRGLSTRLFFLWLSAAA